MSLVSFDLKHIDQRQIPEEGMNSILKTVDYNGFSPLYVMKDYQKLVKDIHQFIYEQDSYQLSAKAIEIDKSIYEKFVKSQQ